MTTTYHLHATKGWVIGDIRIHGATQVLGAGWANDEDAIEAIRALATKHVPIGDGCDNRDDDGVCQGHRDKPAEVVTHVDNWWVKR